MQHLQPGATLQGGKYRIDAVIGKGGFGNTYVATDSRNTKVAIKEFFWKGVCERDEATGGVSVSDIAHYGNFRQQKEKFKTEARRLQQFNTPHIVKVYDLFEENGTAYYVMDYIDGENLSDRMRRLNRALTEDEVREMLPQILEALRCVHAAGLWHLDLKPSNIMIDRRGNVKLIDFGASKQFDAQTGGATAKTRQTYTNGYAPREQMDENFSLYGAWTDIYSLGATLYCLLTKRRPPMPSDIDDDQSPDKHEALPFPATVSEQMRSLVRRMMNTSRQKRPQNVDEVMAMLGISAGNAYGGGTQSQYDEATAFASQPNDEATSFASQPEGDATQMAQGQTAQGPSNEQTRFSGNGGSNEETVYSQQASGGYQAPYVQPSNNSMNVAGPIIIILLIIIPLFVFIGYRGCSNKVPENTVIDSLAADTMLVDSAIADTFATADSVAVDPVAAESAVSVEDDDLMSRSSKNEAEEALKFLKNDVAVSNGSCPLRFDEGMILTSIRMSRGDDYIVYRVECDEEETSADEIDEESDEVKKQLVKNLRRNRGYIEYLKKANVGVIYYFYDATDEDENVRIVINPSEL